PVLIEDFPDDDPRARPDSPWRPPSLPAAVLDGTSADRLQREIAALQRGHDRLVTLRGRTTVGLSGLTLPEIGRYIAAWLSGPPPASPRDGFSAVLALRFAVDDLKAFYLEAAAGDVKPSSRQLGD